MNKRFKSAISLLLTMVMLTGIAPFSIHAAVDQGIEIETVAPIGSASFEGEDLLAAMGDNWFLNQYDRKVLDDAGNTSTLSANLDKMIKLTEVGDGLEFTLVEKAIVKRLDLWIISLGGIEDYTVLVSEDGVNYDITVADAQFPLYNGSAVATDADAVSSYYPIVFDAPVEAKSIKFVVDSFADNSSTAYISEARLYDTNDINLGKNIALQGPKKLSNNNYLTGFSPYICEYSSYGKLSQSGTKVSSSDDFYYSKRADTAKWVPGQMWPYYQNSTSAILVAPVNHSDASLSYFWWGTTFGHSKVKINKIGLNLVHAGSKAKGTVTEFEVWVTQNHDNMIGKKIASDPTKTTEAVNSWAKVATINCNLTTDNTDTLFEIPEALEASAILVKITGFTGVPMLRGVSMYSKAEAELSGISRATANVFDTVITTDTSDNTVASENIFGLDTTSFEFENNTYNVKFSEDSELVDENGNISFHEEDEEIVITAVVSSTENADIKYSISKKFTLLARKNECVISVAGVETELLTDGFLFSSYDNEKEGNAGAAASLEKFIKLSPDNNEVEYSWFVPNESQRLELWSWPANAIREYEIYSSDDGNDWNLEKSGVMNESLASTSEEYNYATYSPIVFEKVTSKKLKFVVKSFNEGFEEVYLSEANFINTNNINLSGAPESATGSDIAFSHYMTSYIVSNTSDSDPMYRKNLTSVWPMYEDGTSPSVTADGGEIWYATASSSPETKINRIIVPILEGSAKEIEILYATGEESGFDMSAEFPVAPDKNGSWNKAAIVRGTFNSSNPVVIDLADAPSAKFWMVRAKGASSGATLGRVGFYILNENDIDPILNALNEIFNAVSTDTESDNKVKTQIGLFDTYTFNGREYDVQWESSSKLINLETGEISDHDRQETAVLTAIVSDTENTDVSYCISKEYVLEGMMRVSAFDTASNLINADIINDNFYYTAHEKGLLSDPKNAYYNPDKFMHFDEVNSGFEFYWEKPRSLKRLHIWSWPVAAIRDYEIQISTNGTDWTTHYSGTLPDQYENDPDSRPADNEDSAGTAVFYPIVFEEPTGDTQYIRFVIKSFRNIEQGAYIAEACFLETNDINYLGFKTIPGTEDSKSYKVRSLYTTHYYLSDTTDGSNNPGYRRKDISIWPVYSSSGTTLGIVKSADNPENFFYATGFQGAPVTVNKATITVSKGEVLEFEVKCAEGLTSGLKWTDFPPAPDTQADYKTVARVSGKFTPGTYEVHFDNSFESRYWMIKITQATDDAVISGLGLYELAENELNASSFVLDGIFDNVSDTALDNVIKKKFNLPTTFEKNGKTFEIIWTYDSSMVNSDGTLIPAMEDRRMVLKARVGSPGEPYKHVLEKEYYLLGQDSSERTNICYDENIVITDSSTKSLSCALEHQFTFTGKKEIEINFNEAMTGGRVKLMAGNEDVLNLARIGDEIVINQGTESEMRFGYAPKIKLDVSEGNYSLSVYNGVYYNVVAYDQKLLSTKDFDTLLLVGSEGETLAIDNLVVKVASNLLFNSIKEQFDFEKISPAYRATNLNGNLTLIDKVGDVTFTYESGNSSIIDIESIPGTGVVNVDAPAETYIKVTGTSSATNDTFTKTFKVIVGKNNLFGQAKSASPATAIEGSNSIYAVDGCLETAFITTARSYRINIDLQERKTFSKFRIIEAVTDSKISEYKIEVSDNNVDFTEIYNNSDAEVKGIDSNALISVPYSEARFVRITVTKTTGIGTGILDVCAYNEMTDSEKLENDYNSLVNGLEIKNGTIIPKTGKLGTVFTLTSNTDVVKITETADKASWKVTAGSTDIETTVVITLNAVNGTASAPPKTYSFVLLADTDIRDNVISGAGGAGGSGGSGGSGGADGSGGSADSGITAITPNPDKGVYEGSELDGHWGANEIKNLVKKGIVEGDGKSLNLSSRVTRAEFCKMIVVALGLELENYDSYFNDISENAWYASYAQTAAKNGIISGDGGSFRGDDSISRQEMAVVLINALKTKNPEIVVDEEISFTDNDSIALWAEESVKTAVKLGLLKGYDTGDFKPVNSLKRDEAMVVIYRLLSELEK